MPPVVDGLRRIGRRTARRTTVWRRASVRIGLGAAAARRIGTGPGMCDNYKVGPRWHITADGMVMSREDTDLAALTAAMPTSFPVGGASGIVGSPTPEQFDRGPGGRITFMSQIGRCRGWDMQGAYEGVTEWNASVVYPIQNFDPVFYSPVITTTTTTAVTVVGVCRTRRRQRRPP